MRGTSTFGSAQFQNNTGGKQSGSGNSGSVNRCSNLNLNATNCELLISKTNDTSVTASNSRLNFGRTTNSSIDGINNAIEFRRIHNANFVGNDNQIYATDSSDLDLKTEKSKLFVTDAKNCNISAKSMDIKLLDSYNVCINGDGGNVHIEKAYNHTVTTVQSTGEVIQNCITFAKSDDVSKWASSVAETSKDIPDFENLAKLKVSTTFDSNFRISEQSMFEIDGVTVTILPRKENLPFGVYEVFIAADVSSIGQTVLGPSEVELTATVEGKKHVLKFEAPEIVQHSNGYGTSGVYFRL